MCISMIEDNKNYIELQMRRNVQIEVKIDTEREMIKSYASAWLKVHKYLNTMEKRKKENIESSLLYMLMISIECH